MEQRSPKIIVTAGPTIEPIDPVRYISNFSTGVMGYAIAGEAEKKGFDVCLISGPVDIAPPPGVRHINVTTASDMLEKINLEKEDSVCIVMSAAVCDFKPVAVSENKIKKGNDRVSLELEENPDILKLLGKPEGLLKVGFALETEDAVENGRKKLEEKGLDLIVVNERNAENNPFGAGKKNFFIVGVSGESREYRAISKEDMAKEIMDELEKLL